jgi:phosphoribosylaminoimidazole carboxylase (NCAIR synthetase)
LKQLLRGNSVRQEAVLEAFVDFEKEGSVVAGRETTVGGNFAH